MSDGPVLSVIVPTLDEAEHLPGLLADVQAVDGEIIVVDGGSSDETVALARRAGARTLHAEAGRD
ncbi:MAG: glycosyltransferase, partial [Gemmatimonadetes bacterium]|nr:glycosyltransferase [Gemmatimonadota bacterium]